MQASLAILRWTPMMAVPQQATFARSGRTAQWQRLVPESWKEPPCAGRKRQL
jgi:hypothetical protein